MDNDRHRLSCQGGEDVKKSTQEINSNSSFVGKRKKMRKKKHCGYLQEWLDKSCSFEEESETLYASETEHHFINNPSYWPSHTSIPRASGQRLCTSLSNPTMCHYSVPSLPLGYSIEPGSLPMCAMYPSSLQPSQTWRSVHGLQRASTRGQRLSKYIPTVPSFRSSWKPTHQVLKTGPTSSKPTKVSSQPADQNQDCTSLPPQVESQESDASRRRFSDPGLGPSPVGNGVSEPGAESSDSESSLSSSVKSGVVIELVEQVNALRSSNKQLSRELLHTRNQLHALRVQAVSWKPPKTEYQPGLLSDLVREVREAAQVREEAFLARVRHIVGDSHWNVTSPTHGHSQADIKTGLIQPSPSTDLILQSNVDERLGRIEVHLQNLQIQASHKDCNLNSIHQEAVSVVREEMPVHPLPDQLADLEKEKVDLRCKLQAALNSRKAAEIHIQKLERLVSILRKKINGATVDEQAFASLDQCPSSLENTSESLASVCSSSTGSTHSPQVTMSGPVTDL